MENDVTSDGSIMEIQVVSGQFSGGSFKIETLIAFRAETSIKRVFTSSIAGKMFILGI